MRDVGEGSALLGVFEGSLFPLSLPLPVPEPFLADKALLRVFLPQPNAAVMPPSPDEACRGLVALLSFDVVSLSCVMDVSLWLPLRPDVAVSATACC